MSFGLRVWRLEQTPPGFRDDELINTQILSQKVLDGDWAVYYSDASGHEALYHVLNAITIKLVGRNAFGLRLTSVYLGLLTVPLLYQVGRRLFNRRIGWIAASALSVSFWGLMYSRTAIRHVSLPFFALLAFYFFWSYLQPARHLARPTMRAALLSGICLGLSFYVYFAARGLPLLLVAFLVYLAAVNRQLISERWLGLVLLFPYLASPGNSACANFAEPTRR